MPDIAPPASTSPASVPVQAEMQKPPELTRTPPTCAACDMMVTLGILTSSCESIEDPAKRTTCKTLLKPLEDSKAKAVDILADVIVELGEEHLDDTVERFNLLLYSATAKAKERLIEKGVLDTNGNPVAKS